ncbi:hypothetical protein ABZ690_24890, partial [Streptomyces sp. NPDC006967]
MMNTAWMETADLAAGRGALGIGLGVAAVAVLALLIGTDARRKEVYWARYTDSRTRLTEPAVDRPADIA